MNITSTVAPVTKSFIDAVSVGTIWHASRPANPAAGDAYFDHSIRCCYIYDGYQWATIGGIDSKESAPIKLPTEDELSKHPTLKSAWEDYVIIRKLLGI